MSYTPNVPQANQTIASTQQPIEANFQFIQTDAQVEHCFNGTPSGQAEGTHLRASMPNQSDPGSLPAGTNGMYYIGGAVPKFYDGTNVYFIQLGKKSQSILSGTVSLTTSYTNVANLPTGAYGTYYIWRPASSGSGSSGLQCFGLGQFVSNTDTAEISDTSDPNMSLKTTGLILQAETTSSSNNGTYNYVIVYSIP